MVLTSQLRNLVKLRTAQEAGQSFVKGVFATPALKAGARRLKLQKLTAALSVLADIDRIATAFPALLRMRNPLHSQRRAIFSSGDHTHAGIHVAQGTH